jgi:predicted kinase
MQRPLQRLIVMAGLLGTGKSCIAEAIGREMGYPVFAKDWLEAALCRSGLAQTPETAHLAGYVSTCQINMRTTLSLLAVI